MRKFLIATHGAFAQGIKSSLDLIVGETENLYLIQAYLDQNISVEDELMPILDALQEEDELIIFTDLLGGSVNNIMLREALRDNVHIISGFNLPLLIEVVLGDADTPVDELISDAIENAKAQLAYVNILGDADTPVDELISDAIENAKAQLAYVNKLVEAQQQNDFDND